MFGFSFGELLVICVVALVFVGPKKLPTLLQTLGQWLRKLRNLTNDVRSQTGIDDLLRSEGINGGLNELRGLLRGNHGVHFDPPRIESPRPQPEDPYANVDIDTSREYPLEGADAYGALPDDLIDDEPPVAAPAVTRPETEVPTTAPVPGPTESV